MSDIFVCEYPKLEPDISFSTYTLFIKLAFIYLAPKASTRNKVCICGMKFDRPRSARVALERLH